jgi:hypothetical protein
MATLVQKFTPARATASAWLLIPAAAAVLAALIQSFLIPLDCDVSWLITVNEKLLGGHRLYVDIIEPNPPASVWLYTPEVWLAQVLALRPESVVAALFITAGIASCMATVKLSAGLADPFKARLLLAITSFVTLILPLGTFAQREHAALLLALPVIAGLAATAERQTLGRGTQIALGIGAGAVVIIKPHFILAIAAPATFAWFRARSIRPLILPAAAAAGAVASYTLALVAVAPDYLRLIPMLAAVYLPLREEWPTLLAGPVVAVPAALYALLWALRPPKLPPLAGTALFGSIGFAAAALLQMKGYLNHALPAMALGFVAVVMAAASPGVDRAKAKLVLGVTALLAAFELYAMGSIRPPNGLLSAVERVAPPHPTMMTLGPDLLTGHPVVRNVGGTWAGSRPALFIAAGARRADAEGSHEDKRQLRAWYEADLASFASEVAAKRPDVVLVDARPEVAWLRSDHVIKQAMQGYRPAARAEDVEVWLRR